MFHSLCGKPQVAQYCNKLLKKPDQCRMISLCSMLFWPPKNPDGTERYSDCDRVLECMQRALKIASVCNTALFVEILDRYARTRSVFFVVQYI